MHPHTQSSWVTFMITFAAWVLQEWHWGSLTHWNSCWALYAQFSFLKKHMLLRCLCVDSAYQLLLRGRKLGETMSPVMWAARTASPRPFCGRQVNFWTWGDDADRKSIWGDYPPTMPADKAKHFSVPSVRLKEDWSLLRRELWGWHGRIQPSLLPPRALWLGQGGSWYLLLNVTASELSEFKGKTGDWALS